MKYYYKAHTPEGSKSGVLEAASKKNAANYLISNGYNIIKIRKAKKFNQKSFWNFVETLSVLLNQKVMLAEALHLLGSSKIDSISSISHFLNDELSEGNDFFISVENLFSDVEPEIISLLRVGYENGDLVKSLELVLKARAEKTAFIAEVQKAITYPAFVLIVSIVVLVIIFDNVLPEFKLLLNSNTQNPLTSFIMSFAGKGYQTLISGFWSTVSILFLYALAARNSKIRLAIEKCLEYVPLINDLLRLKTKLAFLQNISLALCLKSDLKTAIRLSVSATTNEYHKITLKRVEEEIFQGTQFGDALKRTKLFNQIELLRISLAEQSGTLPKVFQSLLDINRQNQRKKLNFLVQLLGPVTIILLGCLVFLVAFTVVTPMMTMQQTVG